IALAWSQRPWKPFVFWSGGASPGVRTAQALNVWIIQAVVAIGPPLGAVLFQVYIKTDWGIPLFFLVSLALVAIPSLRVRGLTVCRRTATWLLLTLSVLVASPKIVAYEVGQNRNEGASYR